MAAPHKKLFAALDGEEGEIISKLSNPSPKKVSPPLPWGPQKRKQHKPPSKKQQEAKLSPQMRAKPLILPAHVLSNQFVLLRSKPSDKEGKQSNNAATNYGMQNQLQSNYKSNGMQNNKGRLIFNNRSKIGSDDHKIISSKVETETQGNLEKEEQVPNLTLKEYEKQLLEKKTALNSLNNSAEQQRMVDLDKDFESMKLVGKKKLEESEKDKKLNKKESCNLVNEEKKVAKSMSINEFLKPVQGTRQRTFAANSQFVSKLSSGQEIKVEDGAAIRFEDPRQFPGLPGGSSRA